MKNFNILLIAIIACTGLAACKKTTATYGPLQTTNTDIKSLRSQLDIATDGVKLTVPDGSIITGTVISSTLQEAPGVVYLQDAATGFGMRIQFTVPQNFSPGQNVQVYIAKQTLAIVGGDYQIGDVPLVYANVTGNTVLSPRSTMIDSAVANFKAWSSTLIKLKSLKKTAKLNDSTFTLADSLTGRTIQTFVSKRLGYVFPDSVKSLTGYLVKSDNMIQVRMRTTADVEKYPVMVADTLREAFDKGGQPNYASGDQIFTGFTSGDWIFNDAAAYDLTQTSDLHNGSGSVRLRGKAAATGYIYTNFDVRGLKKIRFNFGGSNLGEGGDEVKQYAVEVFISKNAGITWTSLGVKNGVRGTFTRMEYAVTSLPTDNIRVKILNASFLRSAGTKLRANVDDVELIH